MTAAANDPVPPASACSISRLRCLLLLMSLPVLAVLAVLAVAIQLNPGGPGLIWQVRGRKRRC